MIEVPSPPPRQTPLVLIADDDSSLRSLLQMALEGNGYQVEEALNGEECLVKYSRLQPDLVLLDAVMPEMDGFSCCQQLRSRPGGEQIPILMITFLDDRKSIDRAFQAGATDYITKPIHWSVLRQRVRYLLDASQRWQQLESLQAQCLSQHAWEKWLRTVLRQLSPSKQAENYLPNLLANLQTFFEVERVLLYPLASPHCLESVALGYPSVQAFSLPDLGLETLYHPQYQQGQAMAIPDLKQAGLPLPLLEQFNRLQTQAVLLVPILIQDQVWGLLCAHRAEAVPQWNAIAVERFQDVANLLSLVLSHQ